MSVFVHVSVYVSVYVSVHVSVYVSVLPPFHWCHVLSLCVYVDLVMKVILSKCHYS